MTALTPFARRLLARVADRSSIPRYGTPEWAALPQTDPRHAAAVVIAAEAWRDHCSPERIAEDMSREMQERRDAIAAACLESSWDVGQAADWEQLFRRPTYADLCERRNEPEKARLQREKLRELGVA